jgi:hypothetical protein
VASWEIMENGTAAFVEATVPKGTEGRLVLPGGAVAECEGRTYSSADGGVMLVGGKRTKVNLTGDFLTKRDSMLGVA